ncbi:MAG: fatty acid--CoA ligase family protein [Actinobacteria bacterium]|nr:fatty acid--CoA ligase family protein [Actinomycetota bacterium]
MAQAGGADGLRGDERWGTTPRLLLDAAERFGDREAIADGDVHLTFAALSREVTDTARSFLVAGVERGDRIAIWAPNIHEWVITLLAAHMAGAVLVPLNTRFKGREAADILERSGASHLFTVNGFLDTDYVDLLRKEKVELPTLREIVVIRGDAPYGTMPWSDFLARGLEATHVDVERRRASVKPDDLSDILFTSGTTGLPKGAMCTHSQTVRAYADWADVVGLQEGDRYLIVNPFFHAFGYKAGILACLMTGATIVPHAVFDPAAVLQRISEEGISMLPGPPSLFQAILNTPDLARHDLSSLRLAVTGAAVIPVELIVRMRAELGFERVITGYGLTEASGIATMCRHDDDPETIATTSGRAIPGVEVEVVGAAGAEVDRGTPGEVVVRGYNVMLGYLDDPAQTAEVIDEDGWLHTGDVGVMDERGYLRITDRMKDMFIVGGFNAYPAEIENLLLGHPAIAQAAVVGVPDERLGEVGVAFVVAAAGETVDPDEVVAWARDHMANYKVPRRVEVVEGLPLNASGKVLKFELRERARGG